MRQRLQSARIAIVGLGYVGLPLAVAFAAEHDVIGFDVSAERVADHRRGRRRAPAGRSGDDPRPNFLAPTLQVRASSHDKSGRGSSR